MSNKEFSDLGIEHKSYNCALFSIINSVTNYDTNPPYQRGFVWSNKDRVNLINSIIEGIPINVMHLVIKDPENTNVRWILDGKQRYETLAAFVRNEFPITKNIGGKIYKNIFWKNISDPNHEAYKKMHSRFEDYNVQVVLWDHTDFENQKKIFERVNISKTLNPSERIYCRHYLTKSLLKYFYESMIKNTGLINSLRKECVEDKRFAGVALIHSILLSCYGCRLDGGFAQREFSKAVLEKSADEIDLILYKAGFAANNEFDKDWITKLNLDMQYQQAVKASRWFLMGLNYNNRNISKKVDSGVYRDICCFFVKKMNDNILTNSFAEQHTEDINKFICAYIDYRINNPDIKRGSSIKKQIQRRFDVMENIFNDLKIDNSPKTKNYSNDEESLARIKSNGICPITGVQITDQNAVLDHVDPKSTNSETKFAVISKEANRRKNDTTEETTIKEIEYIKSIKNDI